MNSEAQLLQILTELQSPQEGPRKQAEAQIASLYSNQEFPPTLVALASHDSVTTDLRQAALLVLKTYVISTWSPSLDEFKGQVYLDEPHKELVRSAILTLATGTVAEHKVRNAASYVVSKIAISDFPDEWPNLLPTLLHVLENGSDEQVYGALKVLGDLVEDALSDDQFFRVARDLVKVIYNIASGEGRKNRLRALAISVFRSAVDMLDMLQDGHGDAVKAFADEALNVWIPLFNSILAQQLPEPPQDLDTDTPERNEYNGRITLKVQVVKTLMKIRELFASLLAPQSPALFQTTWHELSLVQAQYVKLQIEDDQQGHLTDADGLPFSIDFLVLEELDFLQACLRAPPVRKELEGQLQTAAAGGETVDWITELLKVAVTYAHVTAEEASLWEFDVNVYLTEETGITMNYTPRTSCGDLVIKLGEWVRTPVLERISAYAKHIFETVPDWKTKEAILYLVGQFLNDMVGTEFELSSNHATTFLELANFATQDQESVFLRARGFMVASMVMKVAGASMEGIKANLFERTLLGATSDESEVVKIMCIRALQPYIESLSAPAHKEYQEKIIEAIGDYYASQDPNELSDNEDTVVSLVETLRDAIMIDVSVCIGPSQALKLLLTIASHGARMLQLTALVTETFEDIAAAISQSGAQPFAEFCARVVPSITGAFDVANLTSDTNLADLAAELLLNLAQHGSEPLPPGFVAAVMPKLSTLLMNSEEGSLLRPATEALKFILAHDHKQLLEWHNSEGKSGLEVILIIIDRLLQPGVDDNAAREVGGLAAELVEKAGSERLGPYLLQLLTAVAVRLATAEQVGFIQNLSLVFARLCLVGAKDVVEFLQPIQVGDQSGLQVVMSKWLENSTVFSGFDEVRQNVIALSKLYSLEHPVLAQILVKGDLIVPESDVIMTRSKAKKNPDRFTMIPVPLKIIKVLVQELSSQGADPERTFVSAAAAEAAEDLEEEDGDADWEDMPAALDLSSPQVRNDLMGFAEGTSSFMNSQRRQDDETQAYLIDFFRDISNSNVGNFEAIFGALSQEEQMTLKTLFSHVLT